MHKAMHKAMQKDAQNNAQQCTTIQNIAKYFDFYLTKNHPGVDQREGLLFCTKFMCNPFKIENFVID